MELLSKKTLSNQSSQSTVEMFLKTNRMFKKILEEIDILEEYYSSKLGPNVFKIGGIIKDT
jgi:hypothetical protein